MTLTSRCGPTLPTVATRRSIGVVVPGLGGDRRGLGHAVADRHLGHAHPVDDLLHYLDRAGRACHDAGAQAGQVEAREFFGRELGDEHRGDAVERGAALLLDRLEGLDRVEARGGDDHRGAVGGRGQVAHHHAEAVIEGHRDADLVLGRVAAQFADEEAVVEDVVVGQGGALREAGGSRGVLDVDRLVGRKLDGVELRLVGVLAGLEERLPFGGAEQDHLLQVGAVRADLGDHRGVVGGLEFLGGDQQFAAGLVEDELELAGAVGGVDVDQDRADLGGGVLGEGPLGAVRGPDPDAVALGDARGQEAEGEGVDFGVQPGVAQPDPGRPVDQGELVGVAGDGAVQVLADGVAEQRRFAGRGRVALLCHGLCSPCVPRVPRR